MSALITNATNWNSLKETLDEIISDKDSGKARCNYDQWVKTKSIDEAYVDYLEVGGPGFLAAKPEGAEMQRGVRKEGYMSRFTPVVYGLQLVITQEARDDNKYPEAIALTKALKRSAHKTIDMLCTKVLVDAWDTASPLGDGLPLFSSSHTTPNGSTWSNEMAVPMSPSVEAYATARSAVRKFVDHAGVVEGNEIEKVLCPTEQEPVWEAILYSAKTPDAGNFAEINIMNRDMGSSKTAIVPLRFWDNTTTNYAFQTDADHGMHLFERKGLTPVSWVGDGQLTLHEGVYTRFDYGVIDARSHYGVQM